MAFSVKWNFLGATPSAFPALALDGHLERWDVRHGGGELGGGKGDEKNRIPETNSKSTVKIVKLPKREGWYEPTTSIFRCETVSQIVLG